MVVVMERTDSCVGLQAQRVLGYVINVINALAALCVWWGGSVSTSARGGSL